MTLTTRMIITISSYSTNIYDRIFHIVFMEGARFIGGNGSDPRLWAAVAEQRKAFARRNRSEKRGENPATKGRRVENGLRPFFPFK